jgi:hypothetical protein
MRAELWSFETVWGAGSRRVKEGGGCGRVRIEKAHFVAMGLDRYM